MIWHCMILERTSCGGILLIQPFVIVYLQSKMRIVFLNQIEGDMLIHQHWLANLSSFVPPHSLYSEPVYNTFLCKRGYPQDLGYYCQSIHLTNATNSRSFAVCGNITLKLNPKWF